MAPSAAAAKACPFSDASVDFHPFDLADPYPFYEWARHQAPVFFSPELNYFVVARYADIKAVFDDWRTFSSENAQAPLRPIGEEARRVMREGGFTAYSDFPPAFRRTTRASASWSRAASGCAGSGPSSRRSARS